MASYNWERRKQGEWLEERTDTEILMKLMMIKEEQ